MLQVEEKIAQKRKRLAEEQQKIAEGYGGQTVKNVEVLKKEIDELEDKKDVLDKITLFINQSINQSKNYESIIKNCQYI